MADLRLDVKDPEGPMPIGEETAYELHVRNRGTKAAEDVEVVAYFSAGMEPVSADVRRIASPRDKWSSAACPAWRPAGRSACGSAPRRYARQPCLLRRGTLSLVGNAFSAGRDHALLPGRHGGGPAATAASGEPMQDATAIPGGGEPTPAGEPTAGTHVGRPAAVTFVSGTLRVPAREKRHTEYAGYIYFTPIPYSGVRSKSSAVTHATALSFQTARGSPIFLWSWMASSAASRAVVTPLPGPTGFPRCHVSVHLPCTYSSVFGSRWLRPMRGPNRPRHHGHWQSCE